jgi:GTPase SAR1 family protein
MLQSNYKKYKKQALRIFEKYKVLGDPAKGISFTLPNIETLTKNVAELSKEEFVLAIAGEVKAGKSTFINAFLGEEILPTDPLQATSAIIKIKHSQKKKLTVNFADGKISNFSGEEILEKLKEICSVNEKYRDIPFTLINQSIVEENGDIAVTDEYIKFWAEKSDIQLSEYVDIITEYIEQMTLDKIPLEINLDYPLGFEFEELRIVDTPGVNATGGIQDLSIDYLQNANAIIFVQSATSPAETLSFKKFLTEQISDRCREFLFLAITKSCMIPSETATKYTNIIRLFGDKIKKEHILCVDSLLQIIHKDLNEGKTLKEIRSNNFKKDALRYPKEIVTEDHNKPWNEETAKEIIAELTGFNEMFNLLNQFIESAPRTLLLNILNPLLEGLENTGKQLKEKVDIMRKGLVDPVEAAAEITRKKAAIRKYKVKVAETIEKLNQNYSGTGAEENVNIKLKNARNKSVDTIKKSWISTKESIKKECVDCADDENGICNTYMQSIKTTFQESIQEIGKEFSEEFQITPPVLDMDDILSQATQKSMEKVKKTVYSENKGVFNSVKRFFGGLFGKKDWGNTATIKEVSEFSIAKFKENIYQVIEDFTNKNLKHTQAFLKQHIDPLNKNLDKVVNEFLADIESINAVLTNREITESEIKIYENTITEINDITSLTNDIKNQL